MLGLAALLFWVHSAPQPLEVRVNTVDGQRYIWIPPGSFTMGCPPSDTDCDDAEKPSHRVTLTRGFWIGQTTTTLAAYTRYAHRTGRPMPPNLDNEGRKLNDAAADGNLSVVAVTWEEAAAFCAWAGMRIPSEAEWEYAARAGTTGARYGELDAIAWYADNSGSRPLNSALLFRRDQANYTRRLFENGNGPHPVARKEANAWKLYDMLGNVWQWTADWYDEAFYGRSPENDPTGPPRGEWRVLRGGSWYTTGWDVRAVLRYARAPSNRNNDFGYRCVGN